MLQTANLIPGLVNTIHFTDGFSFIRLLDAEGGILLNLRVSVPDGKLYINDQVENTWRQRLELDLPSKDDPNYLTLHFKAEQHLELWNSKQVLVFNRFPREACERVRYCLLKNASNPGETLISQTLPPADVAARIATKVALRRTEQLEARLKNLHDTTVEVTA